MAQLNLSDFSEKDRAVIESDMSAYSYQEPQSSLGRGLSLTAQGVADGVAGIVGLAPDLVSAMLRKGGFDVSDQSPIGTESIKSALKYLGLRPEIQAKTTTERYIRRIAEEFGYAIPLAIPILGMGARAARLAGVSKIARKPYTGTLRRTRELGRKMFTDAPLQRTITREPVGKIRQAGRGYLERVGADPMGTLRREGLALTAAGAGAQTGRELYPDSLAAEITGQFLGPAGLVALKYIPTPLRIGSKVFNIGKDTAEKMLDENMEAALKQIDPTMIDPSLPGGKETIAKWNAFKELQEIFGLDFDLATYSSQDKRVQALFQTIPFTPDELKAMQIRYAKNAETIERLKVYSNVDNFTSQVDIVSDNVGPVAKGTRNRIVNKIEELEETTTRKMFDVGVKPVSVTIYDDAADASGYLKGRRVATKGRKTPMKPLRRKSELGRKIRSDFEEMHEQDWMVIEETAENLGLNTPVPLNKATQKRIIEVAERYNEYMRLYNPVAALAPADLMDVNYISGLVEGDQGLAAIRRLFHDIGRRQSRLSTTRGGENADAIMALSNMRKSLEDLLSDVHRQIDGDLFARQEFNVINPKLAKKMDPHGQRYVMKEMRDSEGRLTGKEIEEKFPQEGLFWDYDTNTSKNPSLLERELAFREFFKKDYINKWRTGIPLRMREVNRQGFHIIGDERIATAYWGAGSGSGSGNIKQFLSIYPDGKHHLEAALMDDIWHNATKKMGTNKKGQLLKVLDPDRFETWMSANNGRNYEKLLAMGIDPEKFLLDEIDVMKGLQQRMRVFKNRKEVINNNAMLKAFSGYGGIYNAQPVKEIIDAVKDSSGNKMRSVLSIVKGNEAALEGIKQSVWNFAMKLDTPKLGGWIEDNKNSLSLLFAPSEGKMVWTKSGYVYKGGIDHLERMERILSARIMHDGSKDLIPKATGSPETRFKQFEQFMGQSFPSLSNQVWTLYSRFLPARIVVARMISSLFRRMSTDKWNDALKDLFLNPESSNYMDKLVRASNPYGEKISSLRRLHLNWMLLGLEPMSKDTISRESLQSEIPIQDYNKYKKQAEILRKRIEAGDFRRLPSITKRSTEFSVGP